MEASNICSHRPHPYLRTWLSNSFDDESEQDPLSIYYNNLHRKNSGTGILEFSAAKAGQDVTPANYSFSETKKNRKKTLATHSLADALSSVTNLAFTTTHHHNQSTSVHSDEYKTGLKDQLKGTAYVTDIEADLIRLYISRQDQIFSKIEKISE